MRRANTDARRGAASSTSDAIRSTRTLTGTCFCTQAQSCMRRRMERFAPGASRTHLAIENKSSASATRNNTASSCGSSQLGGNTLWISSTHHAGTSPGTHLGGRNYRHCSAESENHGGWPTRILKVKHESLFLPLSRNRLYPYSKYLPLASCLRDNLHPLLNPVILSFQTQ